MGRALPGVLKPHSRIGMCSAAAAVLPLSPCGRGKERTPLRAQRSPIQFSNSPALANAARAGLARFAPRQAKSPLFLAARGTPYSLSPPRFRGDRPPLVKSEGTERREALPYPFVPRFRRKKRGRLSALRCGSRAAAFAAGTGAGSALPGTRLSRSPSPASSSRRGPSAPRAESRASRVQGYEPCPRAPHHPAFPKRPAGTPLAWGGWV